MRLLPPYNLKSSYNKETGMVTFSWDAATDDVTPSGHYNITYTRESKPVQGVFHDSPCRSPNRIYQNEPPARL